MTPASTSASLSLSIVHRLPVTLSIWCQFPRLGWKRGRPTAYLLPQCDKFGRRSFLVTSYSPNNRPSTFVFQRLGNDMDNVLHACKGNSFLGLLVLDDDGTASIKVNRYLQRLDVFVEKVGPGVILHHQPGLKEGIFHDLYE